MPFEPSGPRELRRVRALVRLTAYKIRKLVAVGRKVHIIWDVDSVLCSGRSDDAFAALGFDVNKYFVYEERLIAERLERGPWADLACRCGELQTSQDVVTARSSFLTMRVMFFLLSLRIPARWQLFVGHQSKAESYRIILKSLEKALDTDIFCVDDGKKHIDAFNAMAAELRMAERCHGIISPQVRAYSEDELRHEVDAVMSASGNKPFFIRTYDTETGLVKRLAQVVPEPHKYLRDIFVGGDIETMKGVVVGELRMELEKLADELAPGMPKTDNLLYMLFEMVRSPH